MALFSRRSAVQFNQFKFVPCSHSWVALHPQPKGVIQFVGGALFGTLPTLTYRHFLKSLFDAGYTVVAMPFRSTLRHWSIAIDLLDQHYTLRASLIEMALAKGYESAVYVETASYAWIGHSLGCKYITLLELLSAPGEVLAGYFQERGEKERQLKEIQQGLSCLSVRLRLVEKRIQQLTRQAVDYGRPSIMHQPSLLLAPAITDLDGATPIKLLQQCFSKLLPVSPSVEHTHQLIEQSQLFHLTGIAQFARDRRTAVTCQRLMQEQPHLRRRLFKGNHLDPIGIQLGKFVVDFNPFDKFIQPLNCRDLEFKSLALLNCLRQVPSASCRQTNRTKPLSTHHRLVA